MKQQIRGIHYAYRWQHPYNAQLPTVVALHGFTGSSETFIPMFGQAQNYNILMVDLIGHGQSTVYAHPLRYEVPQLVADLAALLTALAVPTYILYGYSMGARVALAWTVLYPDAVAGLIMESGSPGLATTAERTVRFKQDRRLAIKLMQEPLTAFVDYWQTLPLFASQKALSDDQQKVVRQGRLQQSAFGLAMSLAYGGTGKQPSYWDALATIHCPILYLAGEKDKKFQEIGLKMKDKQPHLTYQLIPEAGHCIHLEQPVVLLQHINQWVSQIESTT